jgi:protein O-GlcNAc transferase
LSKKNRRQTSTQPPFALQAQLQRGLAFHQQGRLAEAEGIYGEILQQAPNHFGALNLLGVIACQHRNHDRAVQLISKAISINPNVASAYSNLGVALKELDRLEEALVSYDKAIALKPDYAEAHSNRGIVLKKLGRLEEALISYDEAIARKPDFEAYYNRGNALKELKRLEEALVSYDKAIALKPDYAEAHSNRGNALRELDRLEEALVSYDKAIALKPDYAEAYSNRGIALKELKRHEEALVSCDKAIALQPNYAEAYSNRGIALKELKRHEEALVSCDKAIALKPHFAEAYSNRGIALKELKRHEEALISYDTAIALKPHFAEAYCNRGIALKELKRLEEALVSYDKAIALKPDLADGSSFVIRMKICEWVDVEDEIVSLENALSTGANALSPFTLLVFPQSPASQLKNARRFIQSKHPKNDRLGAVQTVQRHDRTRIGYFSADFRNHATSNLMCGVFHRHDKSKFETFAFSFNRSNDSMTSRLRQAFDRFFDVQNMSDEQIAVLARDNEIDISVDLMGFTADCRTGIFAYRAAPIQVNYLGFPGTMGSDYIDYIISDEVIIEKSQQTFYAEKVAYLPNSYQGNSYRDDMFSSEKVFARQEVGLPDTGFVFCCFNNNYKITPDVFEIWMRILKQLKGSVLWLLEDNPTAAINLRKEASSRHVDPDRLIFAPRMSLPEHLARHRLADLFLDTLPYNAHTTASDSLWAGVPVLTRIGETFAGRVAASLLTAIGLPELITTSLEAYEALAIDLATNPEKLSSIKNKLAQNRLTAPLFDSDCLTRHLEAAYTAMYERYQADPPPDHMYVPQ